MADDMGSNGPARTTTASRDACDKCHALKTRCERIPESSLCHRCNRLQIPCTYSPPLQLGRPQGRRAPKGSNLHGQNGLKNSAGGTLLQNGERNRKHLRSKEASDETTCDPLATFKKTRSKLAQNHTSQNDTHPEFDEQPPQTSYELDLAPFDGNFQDLPSLESFLDTNSMEAFFPSVQNDIPMFDFENLANFDTAHNTSSVLGDTKYVDRLVHVHLKLLRLHESFAAGIEDISKYGREDLEASTLSSGAEISKDMEDLYVTTEDMLSIIGSVFEISHDYNRTTTGSGLTTLDPSLDDDGLTAPLTPLESPHVSTILLISSCYVRVVHIYQLLIENLQQRSKPNGTTTVPYQLSLDLPVSVGAEFPGEVPEFRMGHSRLRLPPTVTLGLHLHVITQMMGRMKKTLESCTSKPSERPVVAIDPSISQNDKDTLATSTDIHPGLSMIENALPEISLREECLKNALHSAKMSAGV